MSAKSQIFRCNFCKKRLPSEDSISRHIQNTLACRTRWDAALEERHNRYSHGQPSGRLMADVARWEDEHMDVDLSPLPPPSNGQLHVATVEEVRDEDSDEVRYFVQTYPGPVAKILGKGETIFEQWRRENKQAKREHFHPFASDEEWELAVWLIQNVGHNKIEEFLKLTAVGVSSI